MAEFILNYFFIIAALVGSSQLVYFYFRGKKRDSMEEGKVPLLQEQCGGRFGRINLTIPFVRHALYDEFIVISYGKKKYIILYADLATVTLKRHLFSIGVTYSHYRADLPHPLIIWSRSPERVIELVKEKIQRLN